MSTRQEFIAFLEALHKEFVVSGNAWENRDLGSFLEALSRYADDIDGYYNNLNIPVDPDKPSWQLFADILTGARIYE
jgi:hypothetical protein